jgi:predicted branched-subunit amino acid permease
VSRSFLPAEARRGVRDAAPILLGLAPFGLVAGATAVDAGLSPLQAAGLSVVVFAGASQLAAIELLGDNAELLVVLATGVVINLRMLMYSASIAPHFRSFRARWKAACAYILTDQAYALSVARYTGTDVDLDSAARRQYYLAAGGSLWVVWQVCTLVGIVVGARVPPAWGLEFAVPLVFLSLLVPATTSWPKLVAAAVGGGVAVAGAVFAVPLNLGLIAGGAAGVVAGVLADERLSGNGSADTDGTDTDDDVVDTTDDTADHADDTGPGGSH